MLHSYLPQQYPAVPARGGFSAAQPPRTPSSDIPAPPAASLCPAESHPAGKTQKNVVFCQVRKAVKRWKLQKLERCSKNKKSSRTYPLPAQPYHHRIQTGVRLSRSGGAADGASSSVQPLSELCNLAFKTAVLLFKAAGLEGAMNVQRPNSRNENSTDVCDVKS